MASCPYTVEALIPNLLIFIRLGSSHRSYATGGCGNTHHSQAEDLAVGVFPSGQEDCMYEVSCLREEQSGVCASTKQHFRVVRLLGEGEADVPGH